MMTWQRRLRIALGVFIVLFAASVYLAMRRQPPAAPSKPLEKIDPNVQRRVEKGTRYAYQGGKVDYRIDYEAVLEYTGGQPARIRGVKATFLQRNGRDYQVTGDEAAVAEDQSSFSLKGNVRFTTSDGLVLTTDQAFYTHAEDIVHAPGRCEFTKGTMRGSGNNLTYDQKRDVMSFADQFEMTDTGSEGQPASQVHATTGIWARTDKTMRFEHAVKILRAGQTIESDVATLYLTPDEKHLQTVQLQGNSHITGAPATQAGQSGARSSASGVAKTRPDPGQRTSDPGPRTPDTGQPGASSLRDMRARDINLTYREDGETLKNAVLAGDGSVEVASAGSSGSTRITGEFIDFGLEPDGAAMHSLSARGANPDSPAKLDVPAQGDTPRRVIRASSIQGPTPGTEAPAGGGLRTLRFADRVVYSEAPAPPREMRTATARLLDLVMEPGFGALQEARFAGDARLEEGSSLQAAARDARYDVKAGTFEFTGNDDKGGPPFVKDQNQATIRAARIVVTPDNRAVRAFGSVQTTMQPAQKRPDGTTARTPAILAQDKPAYAVSDELQYEGAASLAVFTSKAGSGAAGADRRSKLWQEDGNKIYALDIRVDDTKGDLAAKGNVSTLMKLDQTDAKTNRKEQVETTVNADALLYEDAPHRATYTGHVEMKGGAQGNMKADKAVLFLTADGSALDRLQGSDHIDLQDPGTAESGPRRTTGDRLTYTAADEHYVVTGRLVKMSAQCQGDTEARRLEFWKSIDKMIVDGNAERRTQTKGGTGCKK